MKNVIIFINVSILALLTLFLLGTNEDPSSPLSLATAVKDKGIATEKVRSTTTTVLASASDHGNDRIARRSLTADDERVVMDFVVAMRQQRMLDREQSLLAVQRGTVRSLKDYGSWMVIHQQRMLDDLAKLAHSHGIETLSTLDPSRTFQLSEMQQLHGKKFDARYVKGMTTALKHDLKQLERASYSPDPDVQVFAARYMALTRDNLTKIMEIRKAYRWTR